MNSHEQYTALFEAHRALIEGGSCEPLNAHRQAALDMLNRVGLATKREERYKYTGANEAFAPDFGLNLKRIAPTANPYEAFKCNVPNLSTSLFFVVNDVPCEAPECSRALLPEGVIVDSFTKVAQTKPELLNRFYNRAANTERDFKQGADGVTLLNTMLAQDGLLVYLPAGTELKAPIQAVNVSAARMDFMSVRRVLIVAEKGAKGAVLFCDHAEGTNNYLTTQVVEVFAAEEAQLDLYSIEETTAKNTRFSTVYVEQQSRSRVSYDGVTLTNGTTRNRMDVRLRGTDAASELYGAVIADGKQHVDNNIPGGTPCTTLHERNALQICAERRKPRCVCGQGVCGSGGTANGIATNECQPLRFARSTRLLATDARNLCRRREV